MTVSWFAACRGRGIAEDGTEGPVVARRVDVPEAALRVPDPVRRGVRAGQRGGALVHVRQDRVPPLGEMRGDDSDHAISASKIEDRLTRPHLDRLEEEFRPAVESFPREHARIRLKEEWTAPNRDRGPARPSGPCGSFSEVLSAHARDENPVPGLRPTFTSSGRARV